jgi:hypothetical protein
LHRKHGHIGCGTYRNRPQKWSILKLNVTIDFLRKNQCISMYIGCETYRNRLQKWPVLKKDITIDFLRKNQYRGSHQIITVLNY